MFDKAGVAHMVHCAFIAMVYFHMLVQMFKIKQDGKPVYLFDKILKEFQQNMRVATRNNIKEIKKRNWMKEKGLPKIGMVCQRN